MASGALGYRCAWPHFYAEMMRKIYEAATVAVAFNMLDAASFPPHALLVGHDCVQVLALCENLSPCVKLMRGYLEGDFTVFMY